MTAHIHVSFLSSIVIAFLQYLIIEFFVKFITTKFADTTFGKALAYITE